MTKLCRELGPCANHGPKSLHATCECKDPKLTKKGKKKNKNKDSNANAAPVNAVTPSPPAAAPAQTPQQPVPMPPVQQPPYMYPNNYAHTYPNSMACPPFVYHQPFNPHYPPVNQLNNQHHMLSIIVTGTDPNIDKPTLDDDYEPYMILPNEFPARKKRAKPKRSYWTLYDHNGKPRQGGFTNQHILDERENKGRSRRLVAPVREILKWETYIITAVSYDMCQSAIKVQRQYNRSE